MLNKLLQEIVVSIVGKSAEGIVELLNNPKHVNEFILAKKLEITINQTRNILYKISDFGLVSSIRKKDKKKGWYTYFWKFEILKCLEFLKSFLLRNRREVEDEIRLRNSKVFYACKSCGLEYGEDEALLMDFTCDECGEIFSVKDNSKLVKELKKSLLRIDEKLELVNVEMEKEKAKLGKKRALELKKEEKEKEKKKEEARKKRADKKRKEEREKGKESVKKVKTKAKKKKVSKRKSTGKKKVVAKKKKLTKKKKSSKKKPVKKKKVVKKMIIKKKVPKKKVKSKIKRKK